MVFVKKLLSRAPQRPSAKNALQASGCGQCGQTREFRGGVALVRHLFKAGLKVLAVHVRKQGVFLSQFFAITFVAETRSEKTVEHIDSPCFEHIFSQWIR